MNDFKRQRRAVIMRAGQIKVVVDLVKVDEQLSRADIRFWQTYESTTFKSRVLKSLELVKVEGDWRIHRD